MNSLLPESVLQHKKQGFGVPLKYWFRNDLNVFIHDKLLNNNSKISNYLDKKRISEIIMKSSSGGRSQGHQIWSLLFLESWLDNSAKSVR
ncbi:MAG: hypothetical protein HC831_13780 [Chloroflexia bacterium]|nr:hypothetical protein [Bacteroidales bacterium]NJO89888.1 hypothetical protein [Chloroflexia bacterium]